MVRRIWNGFCAAVCLAGGALGAVAADVSWITVDDILKPGYTHHVKTKHHYSYDVLPVLKKTAGGQILVEALLERNK